jgi:hypothetical protein
MGEVDAEPPGPAADLDAFAVHGAGDGADVAAVLLQQRDDASAELVIGRVGVGRLDKAREIRPGRGAMAIEGERVGREVASRR